MSSKKLVRRILIDVVKGSAIYAEFKGNKCIHWFESFDAQSFLEHLSKESKDLLEELNKE